MRTCAISGGEGCGVVIRGDGSCLLLDCEIKDHKLMGVVVAGSGAAGTLERCVVTSNGTGGVYLCEYARLACSHCRFDDNGSAGTHAPTFVLVCGWGGTRLGLWRACDGASTCLHPS